MPCIVFTESTYKNKVTVGKFKYIIFFFKKKAKKKQ